MQPSTDEEYAGLDAIGAKLSRFEVQGADEEYLVCTSCNTRVCAIDEFDTLDILAAVALDHACGS